MSTEALRNIAAAAKRLKILEERERQTGPGGLMHFVRYFWRTLEPGREFVDGWVLHAIAEHLEAVERGEITRLLINVPPGPMRDDSIVETARGPIPLREVCVGDLVLTHRGRYRSVNEVHQQGILPILKITTHSGRITHAAPSHPYLTPTGWVEAGCLQIGDILATVNREEDRPGASGMPAEEARLLGYLVGDGCLTQVTPNFVNAEREVVDDFCRCAEALGFKTTETFTRTYWTVRLNGGRVVRQWLENHSLAGASSYTKRIPAAVMNGDRQTLAEFVGAYWTCDGGFVVRPTRARGSIYRAYGTTVSEDLANDLVYALGLLGIEARLRRKSRPLMTKAQPSGNYISYSIEVQKEEMAARFADLPSLCGKKRNPAERCRRSHSRVLWDDPIVAIDKVPDANCMCLAVNEDHSFVCSGIAVKNSMKSLMANCYFPAWCWGPMRKAYTRWLSFSYSSHLTERDNDRFRILISSKEYKELYGDVFNVVSDAKIQVSNDKMGWKLASSVGGITTGARADFCVADDLHQVAQGESERVRTETVRWFKESMSNRLNDMDKSAIIVIMQRVHSSDVAGAIMEDAEGMGYTRLCIPMRHEIDHPFPTITPIQWKDPRTKDGELAWPERFSPKVVGNLERELGPYAFCTPKESPVLMGDVSLKPISEVRVGDTVMGFTMNTGPRAKGEKFQRRKLVHTKVLAISRSVRPVVRVTLSSGKVVRCTEDHKWYTKRSGLDGHATYLPPKVGRSVFRVCDPEMPQFAPNQAHDVGWLAGFYDGEGSANALKRRNGEKTCCAITFSQGCEKNKNVCERLEATLTKLGFCFNYIEKQRACANWQKTRWYWLVGQNIGLYQKFLHCLKVTKWRERLIAGAMGSNFIIGKERIVAIAPDGEEEVFGLETETGNYVVWGLASSNSAQYQQNPAPRGGGIIKEHWIRTWSHPQNKFPPFIYVIASLDPAYTEKQENDPSALTIWGVFRHPETNEPGIMLVNAWRKWLPLHGETSPKFLGESDSAYARRCGDSWGLIEWVTHSCDAYGVSHLFIEGKASGISVYQEIERLQLFKAWGTELVDTGRQDKTARMNAIQPIFSQGLVWMPERDWADQVIEELLQFPKHKYDDLADATSLGLRKLREMGMLQFQDERLHEEYAEENQPEALQPLYPV